MKRSDTVFFFFFNLDSQSSPCYNSKTFVVIVCTLSGLILLEVLVLLFEAKKLQIIKAKVI